MILRVVIPEHSGDRDQARGLVNPLGRDLSGNDVVLDCAKLLVGTPSFLDEIVKQILVERGANSLRIHDAPARAQQLLERSAANRGMRERMTFPVRS